jgi:alpha-tubulin suppressor-like RCC1 family protein
VEGLESVRGIALGGLHSLAVTRSGVVFQWGRALLPEAKQSLRPIIVKGFEGVCVRRVCAEDITAFAIGESGELFSWGDGDNGLLGHGDTQAQPSPKRIEARLGIPISSVAFGWHHVLALAEDGLVYAWGENKQRAVLGDPHVARELLPKPVEAFRGVRVGSVAAAAHRRYAVADTGELWVWGIDRYGATPLGHGEPVNCPLPKPIASLRGVKVDAVAASSMHTLALADDGRVYAWGSQVAERAGALGLGPSVSDAVLSVRAPQRIPELRVAWGL